MRLVVVFTCGVCL